MKMTELLFVLLDFVETFWFFLEFDFLRFLKILNFFQVFEVFNFYFTFSKVFIFFSNFQFSSKLFIPIRLPWNQQTIQGYTAMTFLSIFFGHVNLTLNGATLVLFISLCLHHRAFYRIFDSIAMKLEKPDKFRNVPDILNEMVRFHISVKGLVNTKFIQKLEFHKFCAFSLCVFVPFRWFLESAAVYSPFVLIQLICCMIFLACCVFQMDLVREQFFIGFHYKWNLVKITIITWFSYALWWYIDDLLHKFACSRNMVMKKNNSFP